jgi:hypothetical protein
MTAEFEDRVARLEEHIVSTRLTPEEWLDRAEQALIASKGVTASAALSELWESRARHALLLAQIVHEHDEIRRLVDEMEIEEDDDAS